MLSKRRPRTASICIRDILQDFAGRRVIGTISATFIYRTAAEMCSGASTALTISASAPTSGPSVRVMQDMMNALFFFWSSTQALPFAIIVTVRSTVLTILRPPLRLSGDIYRLPHLARMTFLSKPAFVWTKRFAVAAEHSC